MTVTLLCVVYGDIYRRYARRMWASARTHFRPAPRVRFLELEGEPGWPNASSCRYRVMLEHAEKIPPGHVFLIDADMALEDTVGPEILADGLTATVHPGFPDPGQVDAPWNQDTAEGSCAWTPNVPRAGVRYHPGAFVGGTRGAFLELAETLEGWMRLDAEAGHLPRWYDEAYLNRYLAERPPALVLDGSYCAWDYLGDTVPRRIVHLDKTAAEVELRGAVDQSEVAA